MLGEKFRITAQAYVRPGEPSDAQSLLSSLRESLSTELEIPDAPGLEALELVLIPRIELPELCVGTRVAYGNRGKSIYLTIDIPSSVWRTYSTDERLSVLASACTAGFSLVRARTLNEAAKKSLADALERARQKLTHNAPPVPLPPNDLARHDVPLPHVRLYKRARESLLYHEAWPQGSKVVEHYGIAGDLGDKRVYDLADGAKATAAVRDILRAPLADGFVEWGDDQYDRLYVVFIGDLRSGRSKSSDDANREHALSEILGWRGLGWCDGTDHGKANFNLLCRVCDFALAKKVLEQELPKTKYRKFAAIVDDSQFTPL